MPGPTPGHRVFGVLPHASSGLHCMPGLIRCVLMREIARTITTLAVAARRRLRRARRPAPPVQVTRPAGITEAMALEHLARAGALKAQGNNRAAEGAYRAAFELDPYLVEAHDGLARLHWPGPDYLAWLAHFHAIRRPAVYLEIGWIRDGRSLSLGPRHARSVSIRRRRSIPNSRPRRISTAKPAIAFSARTGSRDFNCAGLSTRS